MIGLLGIFGGYAEGENQRRKKYTDFAAYGQKLQAQYDMDVRAANDPNHPSYWGMQGAKDRHQSFLAERLTGGNTDLRHVMGIEGMLDAFVRGNGGAMPEPGSDSWFAALSMAASGLSYEAAMGDKSEWSDSRTRGGRSVANAATGDGLGLGKDLSGNDVLLRRDRYSDDHSQIEFLDAAVDEFASFVPFIMNNNGQNEFEMALTSNGIVFGSKQYEAAQKKFGEAQAFWGNGFGAAFLNSEGRGAAQAAHQALDRVARAQGYLNGKRLTAYARPEAPPTTGGSEDETRAKRLELWNKIRGEGPTSSADPSARDEVIFQDAPLGGGGADGTPSSTGVGSPSSTYDQVGYDARHVPTEGRQSVFENNRGGAQRSYSDYGSLWGDALAKRDEPFNRANREMPDEMRVAPDFSPGVMEMQFKRIMEIIEKIAENPGQVTPEELEELELKQKQGWWPHIVNPALEGFKQQLGAAAQEDAVNELYKNMERNRPRTYMLGGRK
jgi:hypothetical protein